MSFIAKNTQGYFLKNSDITTSITSMRHQAKSCKWSSCFFAIAASLLGAMHAWSFSSSSLWSLQILALAGLYGLLLKENFSKNQLIIGMLFGLGWFCTGLWWITISLHVYGNLLAPFAWFFVFIFCAYLALFPTLSIFIWQKLNQNKTKPVLSILIFSCAWLLCEWLRGTFLTGFPWLASGYAHIQGPLSAYAPIVGVYGISGLAALCAALVATFIKISTNTFIQIKNKKASLTKSKLKTQLGLSSSLLASLLLVLGVGHSLSSIAWTYAYGSPLNVRLIQGNIPQDEKFQIQNIASTNLFYLNSLLAKPADLIATPETAFPFLSNELPKNFWRAMKNFSDTTGSTLLFGIVGINNTIDENKNPDDAFPFTNSLMGIQPTTNTIYQYNKHHLVPFGELIPWGFQWFVDLLKIPLGHFQKGAAVQKAIAVKEHLIAPLICYENLFGEAIAKSLREQHQTPDILFNATNLAWFDGSQASYQHLQISRMRTLETGRPLLQVTNTGITAIITAQGHVQDQLQPQVKDFLEGKVQAFRGLTPYIRFGNRPVLLSALLLLLFAWGLSIKHKSTHKTTRQDSSL